MAIAPFGQLAPPLTYEEYVAEGEINLRYDIVNAMREFMPGPTRGHQHILMQLTKLFLRFEPAYRGAQLYFAPLDVLIRSFPLQTRQPDLLLITDKRLALGGIGMDAPVLTVAPELVLEVVSASDRDKQLLNKLADYASIGVNECWVVRPKTRIVEVYALEDQQLTLASTFGEGQEIQSAVFPDLNVPVADVFAE
jgi:Uma2 family endonuclease